ncbi:hypothetical protein BDQ17DRAFT_1351988 [Cyathus striatus]|nr:hypothetical protein BDQ17DRAFT_1351988 [Cyathus striatus]
MQRLHENDSESLPSSIFTCRMGRCRKTFPARYEFEQHVINDHIMIALPTKISSLMSKKPGDGQPTVTARILDNVKFTGSTSQNSDEITSSLPSPPVSSPFSPAAYSPPQARIDDSESLCAPRTPPSHNQVFPNFGSMSSPLQEHVDHDIPTPTFNSLIQQPPAVKKRKLSHSECPTSISSMKSRNFMHGTPSPFSSQDSQASVEKLLTQDKLKLSEAIGSELTGNSVSHPGRFVVSTPQRQIWYQLPVSVSSPFRSGGMQIPPAGPESGEHAPHPITVQSPTSSDNNLTQEHYYPPLQTQAPYQSQCSSEL